MSAVLVKTIGAVYIFPLIIFSAVAISLTQRRILTTKNYWRSPNFQANHDKLMAQRLRYYAHTGAVVRALNFNRLNLSTVSKRESNDETFLLIGIISIFLLIAEYGIASQPAVTGHLEGVELCAQFQCGCSFRREIQRPVE